MHTLLRIAADDREIRMELRGDGVVRGSARAAHLNMVRSSRLVWTPEGEPQWQAGNEGYGPMSLDPQRLASSLLATAGLDAALARCTEAGGVVLLQLESPELWWLPWEMASLGNGSGTLADAARGREVVRLWPAVGGGVGPRADAGDAGGPLVRAALASPRVTSQVDLSAFHAALVARELRYLPTCGRDQVHADALDPAWEPFAQQPALIKLFLGHGVPQTAEVALRFFGSGHGGGRAWSPEDVGVTTLLSALGAGPAAPACLLLLACDSQRGLNARIAANVTLRPGTFVLAAPGKPPMAALVECVGAGLQRLVDGDVVAACQAMRRKLQGALGSSLVLSYQRGEDQTEDLLLADMGWRYIGREVAYVPAHRAWIGLSIKQQKQVYRQAVLHAILPLKTTPVAKALDWQDELGRCLDLKLMHDGNRLPDIRRPELAGFRIQRRPVSRWQYHAVMGGEEPPVQDDLRPVIVTAADAARYADRVGGALPTAEQWEACATRRQADADKESVVRGTDLEQFLSGGSGGPAIDDLLSGCDGSGEWIRAGCCVVGGPVSKHPLRGEFLPQLWRAAADGARHAFRVVWPAT